MTDIDETAARLEELLERATRGNWFVDGLPHNQIIWSDAENRVCFMCHSNGIDEQRDIATGELIPAMKNALPALLLERRALKDQVARLREALAGKDQNQ